MRSDRTGALSDGVFAIAATLLVLESHAPNPASADLWPDLAQEWPAYLAFVVSFATLGSVVLLLLIVAFVPFPTGFLADASAISFVHPGRRPVAPEGSPVVAQSTGGRRRGRQVTSRRCRTAPGW